MKTVEDAKAWAKDNALQLEVDLMDYCREHRGGAWFLREMPRLCRECWASGRWMGGELASLGADERTIRDISFAHGQRCTSQDAWEVAVAYRNAYERTRQVPEPPGLELARRIMDGDRFT